ncbi:MAG: hypothetical protein A2X18_05125 [Bacteroidetes bacterium GWF2_40_14]|nr:MAG: hypothetical protein A2X18_05125 [Bacteroidetes bacterium GWF2_40_14]
MKKIIGQKKNTRFLVVLLLSIPLFLVAFAATGKTNTSNPPSEVDYMIKLEWCLFCGECVDLSDGKIFLNYSSEKANFTNGVITTDLDLGEVSKLVERNCFPDPALLEAIAMCPIAAISYTVIP